MLASRMGGGLGMAPKKAASSGAAAPTPGPELWPQPAFNAAAGLTNVHCSVTGGQLVGDGSETPATSTATLAGGSINVGDKFQYSFYNQGTGGGAGGLVQLSIGSAVPQAGSSQVGTHTGTITIASVANQNIVVKLTDNFSGDVVDNVSVRKLP